VYYLLKDFAGFWEIDPLVNDDALEEISLTRYDKPVRVVHRKHSEFLFMETDVSFESEERVQALIRRMAQFGGTSVSLAQPALEVTLHGPSDRRVTATLGDEISRPGSTFAMRKQRENPMTIIQLAAPEPPKPRPPVSQEEGPVATYEEDSFHKTLTVLMAAYFWLLLEKTTNVLVAGETASGKTTLMNAILSLMNPRAKVVTAEDVLEVNLPGDLHWQRLKTRSQRVGLMHSSSKYDYSLADLLKLALRFSPTILSLGEMRGEESETLAAAITLGFSTITTIHAESAERCVQRLTTPPMRFTEGHVRDITAIATMRKIEMPDGRVVRRVVSVDEIRPVGTNGHSIQNIFRYDYAFDSFSPTTPAEVLDRSYRLNEIGRSHGWSSSRLQWSLANRAAYLSESIKGGKFSTSGLATMVRTYVSEESLRELDRSP
jgi:flagellar protein FlaI